MASRIKYLVADLNEPVLPMYPVEEDNNYFIGLKTFAKHRVATVNMVDLDELAACLNSLIEKYTGVPKETHERVYMEFLEAVNKLPGGGTYRIFITREDAKLNEVGSNKLIVVRSSPLDK